MRDDFEHANDLVTRASLVYEPIIKNAERPDNPHGEGKLLLPLPHNGVGGWLAGLAPAADRAVEACPGRAILPVLYEQRAVGGANTQTDSEEAHA